MVAFDREGCAQGPIAVRAHLEDLFAGAGFDGADGVIGAANGNEFAVGGPTQTVERVVADWSGNGELAFFDIPNLDFAQPRRISAGDGKPLAIG